MRLYRLAAAAFLLMVLCSSACGAAPTQEKSARVDAQAAEVMGRFGRFAAGMTSFSVIVDSEIVTGEENGGKMSLKHSITARKPDCVRVESIGQGDGSLVVNDGKKLVLCIPAMKQYGEREPLPQAQQAMSAAGPGGEFLAGLFAADPAAYYMEGMASCSYEGQEEAGGKPADHLRFSGANNEAPGALRWDLWMQQGDTPVPLKLSARVGTEDDRAEVIYSDWKINPPLTDASFAFTPPEGYEKSDTLLRTGRKVESSELLGKPAPQFSLPLLGGGKADLASHAGKEIVILDFWASWCGPCRDGMPVLDNVAGEYKDKGVVLYAINCEPEDDENTIRAFMNGLKISPAVAQDKDGAVAEAYGVPPYPTTVIVGKDGTVQAVHVGIPRNISLYAPMLKRELDALVEGKKLAK